MSFTAESRERTRPVLPLAGMVDVLFLLLIFFMTASVFRDQESQIDVQLPTAETSESGGAAATQIVVTVTAENRIFVSQREYTLKTLLPVMRGLAEQFPDEAVVVRGDQEADFGLAVAVMDLAQQAGITNVSVATVKSIEDIESE